MDDLVKKELEKNLKAINDNFGFILAGKLPTNEIIKEEFEGIKILVDYCEKLALEGVDAIETI